MMMMMMMMMMMSMTQVLVGPRSLRLHHRLRHRRSGMVREQLQRIHCCQGRVSRSSSSSMLIYDLHHPLSSPSFSLVIIITYSSIAKYFITIIFTLTPSSQSLHIHTIYHPIIIIIMIIIITIIYHHHHHHLSASSITIVTPITPLRAHSYNVLRSIDHHQPS